MAHSTNIISSIKLPNGNTYEIHDAQAIHSAEDLGLSAAMVFKGTKATVADLPSTGNKTGDVWHVTADDFEYVWTDAGVWEELGRPYNFASDSHTHSFSKSVTLSGTASGTVTVPTVSETKKYIKATASKAADTKDNVLGENTTFTTTVTPTTTNIKATASGAAVGANGTAKAITGFGTHTTGTALGADATFSVSGGTATTSKLVTTTVKNPTVTAVTIPNVTGNTEVTASKVKSAGSKTAGSAASWGATVTNGVLEFSWTANTPTAVTLPTFDTVTATNTTLGTALSASSVTTSNVTVATGSVASTGTGSSVATGVSAISVTVNDADEVEAITALGTPTTATALTGVKMTAQPTIALATGATAGTGVVSVATGITSATTTASGDVVSAVTAAGAPSVTLAAGTSTDGIYTGDDVAIGSTSASLTNGTASVSGTVSGTTGEPQ